MDFFAHQDWARRNTRWLIWMFIIAVIILVAGMNGVAQIVMANSAGPRLRDPNFAASVHILVALGTLALIGCGSLFKTWQLRAGGSRIAQMFGGSLLTGGASADEGDRRLLNVVEEMAIASGVPMPEVYVLRNEPAINAFAAGFGHDDAIIAVTQGCLDRLTRDELQGVIGHEFSHILNGDMRINMRLMGVLHGILLIGLIGYYIVRSLGRGRVRASSGRKGGGGGAILMILFIGLALIVIGSLGTFFGQLIKCGISRQREFLADASAVQFTRHPDGIVGALKKIGGNYASARVHNENAAQASHMFIGDAVGRAWTGLMSTHPPIEARIRAIDPNWDGRYPYVEPTTPVAPQYRSDPAYNTPRFSSEMRRPVSGPLRMRADAETLKRRIGTVAPEHVVFGAALRSSFPDSIKAATRVPYSARAVVACLLLDADPVNAENQLRSLVAYNDPELLAEIRRLAPDIRVLGFGARLPLLDLCLPTLKQLSPGQHKAFIAQVQALIAADGPVTLAEYVLYKNLVNHLVPRSQGRLLANYYAMKPLLPHVVALLSALAHAGHQDAEQVTAAFDAGLARFIEQPGSIRPLSKDSIGAKELDLALDQLNQSSPGVKRRLITACAYCISADGTVTAPEAELLRLVSSCLGCPMPPFVDASAAV